MIKKEKFGIILVVFGLTIAIYFTCFGNFIDANGKFDPDVLSKYGGFIGGTVGVLFSLAGYLIILETFKIQRKQQFEVTFFNLFDQFNNFRTNQIGLLDLRNNIYLEQKGYMFFEIFFEKDLGLADEFSKTKIDTIKDAINKHSSHLGRFYSHLNILLHFIYTTHLTEKDISFYTNYIYNQLSSKEKFLSMFYYLHENRKDFEYLKKFEIRDSKELYELIEDIEPSANN